MKPAEILNAKTSTAFFKRWTYRKQKALVKTYLTSTFFSELKSRKKYQNSKCTCPTVLILFYCSIIITESLSTSLKSELQFLPELQPVSKMGKLHTQALNFKDWPFGVIVTRHFRSKLSHLNERVYCKLIGRTSKMLFIKESGSFLRPISPELRKLMVFGWKKHKCKKTLKIFSLTNQFLQSPESIKNCSSEYNNLW